MKSNKTEIAAARRGAAAAATASGNNVSAATIAANKTLADALDRGTLVDRLFR